MPPRRHNSVYNGKWAPIQHNNFDGTERANTAQIRGGLANVEVQNVNGGVNVADVGQATETMVAPAATGLGPATADTTQPQAALATSEPAKRPTRNLPRRGGQTRKAQIATAAKSQPAGSGSQARGTTSVEASDKKQVSASSSKAKAKGKAKARATTIADKATTFNPQDKEARALNTNVSEKVSKAKPAATVAHSGAEEQGTSVPREPVAPQTSEATDKQTSQPDASMVSKSLQGTDTAPSVSPARNTLPSNAAQKSATIEPTVETPQASESSISHASSSKAKRVAEDDGEGETGAKRSRIEDSANDTLLMPVGNPPSPLSGSEQTVPTPHESDRDDFLDSPKLEAPKINYEGNFGSDSLCPSYEVDFLLCDPFSPDPFEGEGLSPF